MKEKDFIKKALQQNIADKEKIRSNILNDVQVKTKNRIKTKKVFSLAAAVILVIAASLIAMMSIYTAPKINAGPNTIAEYSDVLNVIGKYRERDSSYGLRFPKMLSKPSLDAPAAVEQETSNSIDYSKTNIQTEGMDEGDIVKNDGEYIYKLNTDGFYIISAVNGSLTIESSIKIDNYVPQELYISGNKVILLGGIYETYSYNNYSNVSPMMDCMSFFRYSKTEIRIYDITDKTNPELKRQIVVDGNYFTSRLMTQENSLFYMINYNFNYNEESSYIPKISDSAINDGQEKNIPIENIFYYDDISQYSYLIIGHINIGDAEKSLTQYAYLGLGGEIYVSPENIFVASYSYASIYEYNVFGWRKASDSKPQTRIIKISLSDLKHKAEAYVEGNVKDRYSLDEYNGYLRIATSVNYKTFYSNVFVLDSELNIVGKITEISPGETIYSVRFNKEKGSLVTFKKTDPYFNLDFSNPAEPKISKGLKEDGVSYYLHYIGDTDYTIGVGMMSNVIKDIYGERVIWTGLKVSLYDNSSGEAVNIKTIEIEGSCHSEIFHNPKALLYNEERGLFAFTYENWKYNNFGYNYSSMTQGMAIFKFDINAENNADKLVYRNTLSNLNNKIDASSYVFYDSYWKFINRGIQIGDYVYTISDQYIKSYSLDNLEVISTLNLYEE